MPTRPVAFPPARIGDGTRAHRSRGVGPAQDYPCPIGTPVVAPFAAVRAVRSGSLSADGGFALTGYAANGDYWVMQHLSKWLNNGRAAEGALVALSGNTGRKTDGPHVHHYVVLNGTRHNPEDIGLYTPATPAGKPTPTPTEELPVNVVLYLYIPSNNLILVDHLNGTMRQLGNSATDPVRAHFALKPYTKAYDTGDNRIGSQGVEWQKISAGKKYL